MGRNVEIKARANNFEKQRLLAEGLATTPGEHLIQEDTFFNAGIGRLILGIRKQDLLANAYADLLLKGAVHD
jgi:hypothetical protein